VLVGRGAERHRIESLLATARAGTSGVLVVQGEAGIGKSALLGHARAHAGTGGSGRGMTELRMDGVEGEARLAFAGLTELLRPVTAAVADLPSPQADASTAPWPCTPSRPTRWPSGWRCSPCSPPWPRTHRCW
jgi:hypothetical protein